MRQHSRFSPFWVVVFTSCLSIFSLTGIAANYKDYKDEMPQPICVPAILKDGIYIGAGVGYDDYQVRQSISVADVDGGFDHASPSITPRGFLGSLYAGYGRYFDWFYIAGEIFANYSDANAGFSMANYHSNFSVRESYGAGILPGVSIKKVALLYARVGYVRSFFSAKENMPASFNWNTTSWGNGLQYGLGLETLVYKNLSVRGEYTYSSYNYFKSPIKTSYTPINNQFMLSLLYHIDYL